MKPAKSKKKIVPENKSNPTIQDYFKSAAKEPVDRTAPVDCTASDVTSIYNQLLADKVKSFDGEEIDNLTNAGPSRRNNDEGTVNDHEGAAAALLTEGSTSTTDLVVENKPNGCEGCEMWRKKYKELEKTYIKLNLRHTDTLMKNDDLLKTATNKIRSNTEETLDVAEALSLSDNIFTVNEIRYVRSLPLDKSKDSTFILQCVEYAYKDNPATLCNRTLNGTQDRIEFNDGVAAVVRAGKGAMTPEKAKRIEELFIDRVSESKCLAAEFGERIKKTNINKLIAAAIKNVTNKQKMNDGESTQNADLNL